MAKFIPDMQTQQTKVPYFEDQTNSGIPGRGTTKSLGSLQKEIDKHLNQLSAWDITFVPGTYEGKPKRYGFQIHFRHAGGVGRIDCVALPIQRETPNKKDRALAQALYLMRDKFQAMVYAYIYEPGSVPLLPYMIGDTGETVTEAILANGMRPALKSGNGHLEFIDG